MRGIRGAISVSKNKADKINQATKTLLNEIIKRNNLNKEEIVSIVFTATEDLNQEYPAVAARELGFKFIPLMCYQEMKVKKSLEKCLRIMIYVERDCTHEDIEHVYLRKAKTLRPDLMTDETG